MSKAKPHHTSWSLPPSLPLLPKTRLALAYTSPPSPPQDKPKPFPANLPQICVNHVQSFGNAYCAWLVGAMLGSWNLG
jgi:hypothetical protein